MRSEALLSGRTSKRRIELGIEADGVFMTLRIDKDGPHVFLQPDRRPDTILEAEPAIVLGLAAGAIGYDEALPGARLHGDPRVLTTVLVGPQT